MKELPDNYKTASTGDLELLEINHRIQSNEHQSLAALIRRELKKRKKLK
jgi:hypothetical protein